MHRKKGFTLIELLIVMAIIALLAAILFPVFSRARENARRASCQSNLKQIGLGFMQYTQDYDERWPIWYIGYDGNGWADALQPYLKSTQVFQCPNEKTEPITEPTVNGYTDYAYNAQLSDLHSAQATNSSLTILALENMTWNATNNRAFEECPGSFPASGIATNLAEARRHLDGINYIFCDGHVKWLKSETNLRSSKVYNQCSTFTQSGNNATFNVFTP